MTPWPKWALVALGCVLLLALLAWRWKAAVAVAAAAAVAVERARRGKRLASTLREDAKASRAEDAAEDADARAEAKVAADKMREAPLPSEGDPTAKAREWLRR